MKTDSQLSYTSKILTAGQALGFTQTCFHLLAQTQCFGTAH